LLRFVSISGDYAIVGDPFYDCIGAAYIYKREGDNWIKQEKLVQEKLVPSDTTVYGFGYSVSISGDYAIVGSPYFDNWDDYDYQGSTHAYKRIGGSWLEVKRIVPFDGTYKEIFGYSVSISGDYAMIGSESYDGSGAVYTYTLSSIPGDANGDGIVDLKDFMSCQQVLTGMFPSQFHFEAVDFDGNGKLDTGEPTMILRMISGQ